MHHLGSSRKLGKYLLCCFGYQELQDAEFIPSPRRPGDAAAASPGVQQQEGEPKEVIDTKLDLGESSTPAWLKAVSTIIQIIP